MAGVEAFVPAPHRQSTAI